MKTAIKFIIYMLIFSTATVVATAQVTEIAFPNVGFTLPVDIQDPRDGSDRLFILEQAGIIKVMDNDPAASTAEVFLDIRSKVRTSNNEEGLLGMAFHPDYEENGYFYVNHSASNPRRNVIARYTVSDSNPDQADAGSELVIMEFEQPAGNHNGGQIAFGPDGYLYIGTGDGGSGGDPWGNAQNLEVVLGKMLRIDVDNTEGGNNYAIPADNPFVGTPGARPEIYAYGLRNPWRFSFDPETGWLWTGDVGQNQYEEVSIIESGKNYGWDVMEGFHCFEPPTGCDQTGLELPIVEYDHSFGRSITGGHVYRGALNPELYGKYIYADFVSGRIWSLEYDGTGDPVVELLDNTGINISTFGTDANDNLYFAGFGGFIHRFVPTSTSVGDAAESAGSLKVNSLYPNPVPGAVPEAVLSFTIPGSDVVQVSIHDMLGRTVATQESREYSPGTHSISLDVPALEPGSYLISVSTSKARTARVFVVAE